MGRRRRRKKSWTLDEWKKERGHVEEVGGERKEEIVQIPTTDKEIDFGIDFSDIISAYNQPDNIQKVIQPSKESTDKVIDNIRTPSKDRGDDRNLRWGRTQYNGFRVGHYIQTPPLIFTRDGHSVWVGDLYRGSSAFLIASGPSFNEVDKSKLQRPGVLTMTINNAIRSFRSDLWISVDSPTHFIKSVWLDPKVTKFVPICHREKHLFDNEKWEDMETLVGDCPNVLFYRRNEKFRAEQYLFEDTVNWGNHSKDGGGRSILLAAIRILFYIGIRNVFLLGVDFKMTHGEKNYHFEQDRAKGSVNGNNKTYKMLSDRFAQLKPIFEENDFHVFNCNPESELKVFPFVELDDAIAAATKHLPDIENERTAGLYERESLEKEKRKKEEEARRKKANE